MVLAAVLLTTATLARTDAGSTPTELIDRDNLFSWVAVARIVIALCCGWVAVSLVLASNRRFAQLPRPVYESPDERPRTW